jgi:ATP-dependent exoDNAse (exonuclease V) beta subunit
MNVLYFLHEHLQLKTDAHSFFKEVFSNKNESIKNESIFQKLKAFEIHFNINAFYQLPFYEKIEEIIRASKLASTSDAYVQFFLDVVFDHQRKGTSIQEFLDFWEQKKSNLSIVAPDAENAVQIMTIHKSKGLEFPVVIFPYDIDIYYQKEPKAWLNNLPTKEFGGFEELLVSSSNDIKKINATGEAIYNTQREELELDNFNLLYVALTRPVEQLYVVTDMKINKRQQVNANFSSGVFINYLMENGLWNESQSNYTFGNQHRTGASEVKVSDTIIQDRFISTSKDQHNIFVVANSSKLWQTEQGLAIEFGNLIHEMLSKIVASDDIDKVVKQYEENGELDSESSNEIRIKIFEIINHPLLSGYYNKELVVYNEREIVTVDKQIIIPDRLVFNSNNEAIIIDYKTGASSKSHHQQILKYANELQLLKIKVKKKLLIYIGESILVEEI